MRHAYYTSEELVDATGLCLRAIHSHARKGHLKGTCLSRSFGWRFSAEDVQTWADFYLKPRVRHRLLTALDQPPQPKWCRSNVGPSLHLIFDGIAPHPDCPRHIENDNIEWRPVALRTLPSAGPKCIPCQRIEAALKAKAAGQTTATPAPTPPPTFHNSSPW